MNKPINKKSVSYLTSGHFFSDLCQGALPALLPFFIADRNLTYAVASTLVFIANISSSVVQFLFGYLSDRFSIRWIMPVGLFLAGSGLAFSGVVESFPLILVLVAISGIGISAFHPEAAKLMNAASGRKRSMGMSIFQVGGNAGFALGPILMTISLVAFGLTGTLLLLLPTYIIVGLLFWQLKNFESYKNPNKQDEKGNIIDGTEQWGPFSRLTCTVICRSIIFFSLNTFIPLYWVNILNQSPTIGSAALTLLIITGAIGTLLGGRLADQIGKRKVLLLSFGALGPLLLLFFFTDSIILKTLLLLPIGLTLFSPTSVMVVMGQEYLPRRVGTASGVTLGLAISVGGVTVPLLGWLADLYGLHMALLTVTSLPFIATILSFTLPKSKKIMVDG
jgi:FSR family fosmidomycin resistance protein-like MFS transporter